MYKKIDQNDITYLSTLFDEKYFFTGDDIPEDYSKDELGALVRKPDVLIFVRNANEISSVMKYANDNKIPVVVRGSGTGLVGGCVALEGGIVLCTSKIRCTDILGSDYVRNLDCAVNIFFIRRGGLGFCFDTRRFKSQFRCHILGRDNFITTFFQCFVKCNRHRIIPPLMF